MVAETPAAPAAAGAIVAVGDARSSTGKLPTPDLEGVKQLLTQTRAIGIILPPPDIRAIIDKTAQFVAKNGLEFEKKILLSEANNVKFNFLNATDPYHAYYRMRVKNFSEPEEGEKEAAQEGSTAAAAAATAAAAAAAAAAAQAAVPAPAPVTTRPLEKPAEEKYTVHVPEGLTALDLDLIKLTAQFVARNGAAFLTGLTQREGNNPAFYFLKPTHSMFGFFTSLADAYSAVLMPDKGLRGQLAQDASDRAVILERCLKRLEWDKARAKEAQELEDEIERERLAMQQIDWHDFVVVESIDFYDDEDEELPPPMSLKELVAFNKQQALQGELPEEEEAAAMEQDGEQANGGVAAMDEEERALLAQAAGAAAGDEGAAPPPSLPPPAGVTAAPEMADEEMEDDMDMGDDDTLDDEGPIKVVKNYKRVTGSRMAMTAAGEVYDPTKFAVSPITGELIAHEDMAEHMRISLLDPRWKEQKEAMLNKIKDTTKADDDEITRNLIGLARTRPDIFGSTEEELAEVVTAAVKEKQTSGQGRAVAWDGQTTGGAHLRAQVQNIADNRKDLGSSGTAAAAGSSLPQAGPSSLGPGGQQQQQRAGGNLPPPPVLAPPVRPPQQQQQPPPQQQQQQQRGGPLPPPPMRPPPPMGMGGPGGPPHMHMPPPPMGMGGPPMRPPMPGPPTSMMGGPPMRPPMPLGGPPRGMMPPGPPGAGPAAAAGRPPPQLDREDEAAAKRPRVDFVLTAEDEFLEQHGEGPSRVCIQCPEVPGSDKLVGQMLEVEMASLRDTVGHLKSRLEGVTGVAVNKQKLNREGVGFLRDEMTLAHYNVSPDVVLVLGTKDRGGKKK